MTNLMQILDSLPKLGIQPGPVTQYIGETIADKLEMEGFSAAVQDGNRNVETTHGGSATAQQQQQMQMQVAQGAADTQIKAEREATKQQELQLKAAELFNMHGGNPIQELPGEHPEVKTTIAQDDLPPEGQVQLAAQAGIDISPEQVIAYQKAIADMKAPKPKPNGQ